MTNKTFPDLLWARLLYFIEHHSSTTFIWHLHVKQMYRTVSASGKPSSRGARLLCECTQQHLQAEEHPRDGALFPVPKCPALLQKLMSMSKQTLGEAVLTTRPS